MPRAPDRSRRRIIRVFASTCRGWRAIASCWSRVGARIDAVTTGARSKHFRSAARRPRQCEYADVQYMLGMLHEQRRPSSTQAVEALREAIRHEPVVRGGPTRVGQRCTNGAGDYARSRERVRGTRELEARAWRPMAGWIATTRGQARESTGRALPMHSPRSGERREAIEAVPGKALERCPDYPRRAPSPRRRRFGRRGSSHQAAAGISANPAARQRGAISRASHPARPHLLFDGAARPKPSASSGPRRCSSCDPGSRCRTNVPATGPARAHDSPDPDHADTSEAPWRPRAESAALKPSEATPTGRGTGAMDSYSILALSGPPECSPSRSNEWPPSMGMILEGFAIAVISLATILAARLDRHDPRRPLARPGDWTLRPSSRDSSSTRSRSQVTVSGRRRRDQRTPRGTGCDAARG